MRRRIIPTSILLLLSAPAMAQDTTARVSFPLVSVGSIEDNYLRYMQSIGAARLYPWSVRGFGPQEAQLLANSAHYPALPGSSALSARGFWIRALPLEGDVRFNSSFPYGSNDGAIWAGRGFTPSISAGFVVVAGPISLALDPIVFVAQNTKFDLMPNGQTGDLIFANGRFPGNIDLPQRFGDTPYGRVDPGQSTLRADLVGLTAGVSTANLGWGPMQTYEYVLGDNAAGFPHAFIGTSQPANLWLTHLHFRMIWGRLYQSAYSPVQGTSYYSDQIETGTWRFASGLVVSLQPRGIPGFEIGGARFFHSLWPRTGIPRNYFFKPLESILKKNLPTSPGGLADAQGGEDNQEASAYARWVFPKSGFEIYGEYGREDHNYDRRDLVEEPDHAKSYGLGLRKVMNADSVAVSAIRLESINYQLPTIARSTRSEGGIYIHGTLRQGHTNRGQMLGADTGVGTGAAFTFAWDKYSARGRSTYTLTRIVRQEEGDFYRTGIQNPRAMDVQIGLGAERVRYVSKFELTTSANLIREHNRDFRTNTWNLNALVGLRFHAGR